MATLTEGLIEESLPVVRYHGFNTNKNLTVGGSANIDLSGSTGTFKLPTGTLTGNDSVALAATFAEINRAADTSTRLIAAGSALTVTEALHDGKIIRLDTAAGSTCTLPAASGSGSVFNFVISVVATSNSHIVKVANATDVMFGFAMTLQDGGDTAVFFETASDSDTITLNRTTTGSTQIGEWIEVIDILSGKFAVKVFNVATGTEATPFSATVS